MGVTLNSNTNIKICFKIHVTPFDYSFLLHSISQQVPAVPAFGRDSSSLYTTILNTVECLASLD